MDKKIYYFSSTHWDREWYRSAQEFRYILVKIIDEMIDYLEQNDDFSVFHFDGQTIVLEDYLEVNPQNYSRLKNLICKNRIKIGPWYCMPDEFLVSGEALIRNLNRGHKIANEFGSTSWKVGYLCDIFGHIAQMPQILAGFNINYSMVFRGVGENTTEPFFKWKSPDGTDIITYKIKDKYGYGAFAIEVCGLKARNKEISVDSEEFKKNAQEYIINEVDRTIIPIAVIMDGMDHEPIHIETPNYIKKMQVMFPEHEIVHEDLTNMFCELEKYRNNLQTKSGELYENAVEGSEGPNFVLTHTISSRIRIKQKNDYCQYILEKYLEPLYTFFMLQGKSINETFLEIAWKHLLQNHPHDSICGCSIDRAHKDMEYRFSQVESIYETIKRDSEKTISNGLKYCEKEGGYLTFMNMHSKEYNGVIETKIPFALDFPQYKEPFGYQGINLFRILDNNGIEVKYSIKEIQNNQKILQFSDVAVPVNIYSIVFTANILPFGLTSFKIQPSEKPVRFFGSMIKSTMNIANKNINIQINDNGTINIIDFKTNNVYSNLIDFVDDGEIGDGWNSVRPKCDKRIINGKVSTIEVLIDNPEYCQIKIKKELMIPLQMDYTDTGIRRSNQTVSLPIDIILSLAVNDTAIKVSLNLDNTASGHRLRMVLPIITNKQTYEVNQAFAFVERKCGNNPLTHDNVEIDQLEKAMSGIAIKRNIDNSGLAFIGSYGFYECGTEDSKSSNLYITLFRSFDRVYYTNEIQDSKELGNIDYTFMLMPLNNDISNTNIQQIQEDLKSPINSFITNFDSTKSILSINGNIIVSAIKLANDKSGDMIIRLYNPIMTVEKVKISLKMSIENACFVNLLDEPTDEILTYGVHDIDVIVGAMKILSIRVKLAINI